MVQALEKCQLAETVKEKDGKLDSLGELAFSLFLTILQLGVNSSIRYRNLSSIEWISIRGSNNIRDLSINFHLVHFLSVKPMKLFLGYTVLMSI